MEQRKTSMVCAGIDVAKKHLDAAVHGGAEARFANDVRGIAELGLWLAREGVSRVGIEATGGYEKQVRVFLAGAGLEVVVHQPLEVRLFAKLKRKRAKTTASTLASSPPPRFRSTPSGRPPTLVSASLPNA